VIRFEDVFFSPYLQCFNNIFKGGGTEPPMHYPQWKLISVDVPPVPILLPSLQKLIDGLLLSVS